LSSAAYGGVKRDEWALTMSLIFVVAYALEPMHQRFRANRAKEQRQPEKYHFTS
jgi:hypothetical protein